MAGSFAEVNTMVVSGSTVLERDAQAAECCLYPVHHLYSPYPSLSVLLHRLTHLGHCLLHYSCSNWYSWVSRGAHRIGPFTPSICGGFGTVRDATQIPESWLGSILLGCEGMIARGWSGVVSGPYRPPPELDRYVTRAGVEAKSTIRLRHRILGVRLPAQFWGRDYATLALMNVGWEDLLWTSLN
ncbi:hypothetical protein FA13DRAFT_953588 [Coprinellus micaceus]|uniref:Uncharacterized protein n=1 Tax=Coprinellus micaceus TaxID=71717 RepID=A0A4Y7RYU8_COPMI|nr:hypothetical protein FA13DRAFT_953588 [Coprinellus micaceus]